MAVPPEPGVATAASRGRQAATPAAGGTLRRRGVTGLAVSAVSFALTAAVAVLGPSLMEPALPGGAGQPPWSVAAHPSPYLVIALSGAAIGTAVIGLICSLNASRRGWSPSAMLILLAGIAGAIVLAFLPPIGSSDHLSYAAYGRMALTGHDPYTTTPAMLARLGDPVARAVQDWRTSPSVYGPVAVGGQALAAWIGGTSVRLIIFVLSLLNVLAFGVTGLILHWLHRGDPAGQLRTALLWTANPLLLMVLVAGAHVDSQAIMFGVGGVAVALTAARARQPRNPRPAAADQPGAAAQPASGPLRGAPAGQGVSGPLRGAPAGQGVSGSWPSVLVWAAAGALIGFGFAIKVTTALVGAGLAVGVLLAQRPAPDRRAPGHPGPGRPGLDSPGLGRREPGRRWAATALGGLAGGFCAVAALSLIPWGDGIFAPAARAGSFTSIGSPWRPVRSALRLLAGEGPAEDLVKAGALLLGLVLVILLVRRLRNGTFAGGESRLPAASVFAVVFAWLLAWPYVLPWYDGLGWALLALLPASRLDWLMLARTAALAVGYLPARGISLPVGLGWLETVVRTAITPAALLVIGILAIAWSYKGGRRAPA